MDKYEKSIGLKTIWLTMVRRWKVILIVFVPAIITTLIVTQFFIPKQYQSSVTFLNNSALNATTHSAAQLQVKKDATITKAIQYLQSDYSINMTNDKVLNGISFVAFNANNPGILTVSYTSKTKNVVKPVMESLSKAALETFATVDTYKSMQISSPVSAVKSVGKGSQYLLIGLAASTILGLGIAFVDEIVSDEVYDEDDVVLLGSASYGLIVSKK